MTSRPPSCTQSPDDSQVARMVAVGVRFPRRARHPPTHIGVSP
nr:MAG TPA: hypothetical protein [Caudoviricetes sp.]